MGQWWYLHLIWEGERNRCRLNGVSKVLISGRNQDQVLELLVFNLLSFYNPLNLFFKESVEMYRRLLGFLKGYRSVSWGLFPAGEDKSLGNQNLTISTLLNNDAK